MLIKCLISLGNRTSIFYCVSNVMIMCILLVKVQPPICANCGTSGEASFGTRLVSMIHVSTVSCDLGKGAAVRLVGNVRQGKL